MGQRRRTLSAIDFRPIASACGVSLVILALFMIPPMVADLAVGSEQWQVFLISAVLTGFFGVALILANFQNRYRAISTRQGFMLTTSVWVMAAIFASIPFGLSNLELTTAEAFFEAMSGITTTGATVITGVESLSPGILFWRAILQWLGGIGIIVMGIAILPMLNIGGMQLFRTESSDHSDKILPRAAQIASNTGAIYVALTLLCAVAYALAGMRIFDAVAHSMTTIATGGFSTRDASIGAFDNPTVEWIAILFMIAGGMPFVLYIQAVRGNSAILFRDVQVRWFLAIVICAATILSIYRWVDPERLDPGGETIRGTIFATVTVITGTGYASVDHGAWGPFAIAFIFFLMCVGGCTGSATGGIKIFRFIILYGVSRVQVLRLIQPSGIFRLLYNQQRLPEATATAVLAFVFLFGLTFVVLTMLLGLIGLDYLTAMSGALAALANVGLGLGSIIGPTGNYGELPDAAKWVLAIGMLLGRLELFTVFVLFTKLFWRA